MNVYLAKCYMWGTCTGVTALFNNILTLKFKGQPTNGFFTTVNQMFGGSSQHTTSAGRGFVVWTILNDLITTCLAVVRSWEEPLNIWLTEVKHAFVSWALNFRARMLLKGKVIKIFSIITTGSPSSLVTVNMTLCNGVIIRVCMGNTSILRNSSK